MFQFKVPGLFSFSDTYRCLRSERKGKKVKIDKSSSDKKKKREMQRITVLRFAVFVNKSFAERSLQDQNKYW